MGKSVLMMLRNHPDLCTIKGLLHRVAVSTGMTGEILILCAGDGVRWNNYLGCPKQLAPIRGVPLLERTVTLCRRFVARRPIVVAVDERLRISGVHFLAPARRRWIVETLASSAEGWAARTAVLLGDVFYSERALRTILQHPGELVFFGRRGASYFSGKRYGEIFGLCWQAAGGAMVRWGLSRTAEMARWGGSGKLWDLLKVCQERFGRRAVSFHDVEDETEDFDSPLEFRRLRWLYDRFASPYAWERNLARSLALALFAPRALWRRCKSHCKEMRVRRMEPLMCHCSGPTGSELFSVTSRAVPQ